eukprot:667157-Rhodomonas_salina.1
MVAGTAFGYPGQAADGVSQPANGIYVDPNSSSTLQPTIEHTISAPQPDLKPCLKPGPIWQES